MYCQLLHWYVKELYYDCKSPSLILVVGCWDSTTSYLWLLSVWSTCYVSWFQSILKKVTIIFLFTSRSYLTAEPEKTKFWYVQMSFQNGKNYWRNKALGFFFNLTACHSPNLVKHYPHIGNIFSATYIRIFCLLSILQPNISPFRFPALHKYIYTLWTVISKCKTFLPWTILWLNHAQKYSAKLSVSHFVTTIL